MIFSKPLLVIAITLLLIVSAGALYVERAGVQTRPSTVSKATVYKDPKYHFSINYLPDWHIKQIPDGISIEPNDDDSVWLLVQVNEGQNIFGKPFTGWDYERYLKFLSTGGSSEGIDNAAEPVHVGEQKSAKLAGIDGLQLSMACCAGGSSGILIKKDDNFYLVSKASDSMQPVSDASQAKLTQAYQLAIESFAFDEPQAFRMSEYAAMF